jgi:hypothetical protein
MKRVSRAGSAIADDIATPREVAEALATTEMGLAQMRYRGTGPKFIKRGSRVLYRWSDIRDYLDGRTHERSGT